MSEIEVRDFVFVDPAELTIPPDGPIECLKNYWWAIDAQGRVAFYNPVNRRTGKRRRPGRAAGAPQANPHEALARRVAASLDLWAVDVVFIPIVFRPFNPKDYV